MSLPSPLLSVPSLSSDQISFAGLTLGANTVFGITKLEGLDKPDVRSGNSDRPRARGAFVGTNLLKTRTITVTLDVGPLASNFGGYGNLVTALAALRGATSTEGTTETPLWIQIPNAPLMCCMARVLKKSIPYDYTADRGLVRGASIQFEATDPYLYSAPTSDPTISLPTPGIGFTFPLTFNWSFGGGSTANQYTAINSGDVSCWPVLVITGPTLNPSVSNASIAGNPTVSINQQLNTGDQLVIDCDMQSITFYPSGSSVGAAYPQVLNSGSTFFAIQPGSNVIAFNDQSTSPASGTLGLWFASAYDGIV